MQQIVPGLLDTSVVSSVRVGIRADLRLRLPNDAWWVNGAAQYIAWQSLRRCSTGAVVAQFAKQRDTRAHVAMKSRVNLASWSDGPAPSTTEDRALASARMAFAFEEVKGLVSRHGQQALPRIFVELQSSAKMKEAPESAVLDAIRKVTGEDMGAG